ncbi:MAG: hypothetical protein II127_01830, partial [Ruminococcus sp.]|nr:hypothetical protein [Ruminococcus sp.]
IRVSHKTSEWGHIHTERRKLHRCNLLEPLILSPGLKSDILHGKTGEIAATSRFIAYLCAVTHIVLYYQRGQKASFSAVFRGFLAVELLQTFFEFFMHYADIAYCPRIVYNRKGIFPDCV